MVEDLEQLVLIHLTSKYLFFVILSFILLSTKDVH